MSLLPSFTDATLRPTMLVLDDLPQSCKDILVAGGIQLEFLNAHSASYAEIQLRMSYCNLIAIRTRKTAEIVSYLLSYWPTSRLHAIACFEAGVASAVTIKHIPILELDSAPSPYAVSELCLSLTIALSRQLLTRNRQAHAGVWFKDHTHCHEIRNKTLGILGVESNLQAGHQTGILAQAMGMRVLNHTPELHLMTHGRATNIKDLTTVMQSSDFVAILDDEDLVLDARTMTGETRQKIKRALDGQVLIHTAVGDDNGKRTKKFLNWLEDALHDNKDTKGQGVTNAQADGTAMVTKEENPIRLSGVAIVVPSQDFDDTLAELDVQDGNNVNNGLNDGNESCNDSRDEGYATEDHYAHLKTGRVSNASSNWHASRTTNSALMKQRLEWRDQLKRLGVENVIMVPQFALVTQESQLLNANKFAKKLVDQSQFLVEQEKTRLRTRTVSFDHLYPLMVSNGASSSSVASSSSSLIAQPAMVY